VWCDGTVTGEICDVQLEYLPPDALGLQQSDVPSVGTWPQIKDHRWPFNGNLVSLHVSSQCWCQQHCRIVFRCTFKICHCKLDHTTAAVE
jgi:hypothetical protein